ncbi:MAG: hypothetical protein ACOX17_06570 [Christensenellales bacterium]|jgi:hypothetical protein
MKRWKLLLLVVLFSLSCNGCRLNEQKTVVEATPSIIEELPAQGSIKVLLMGEQAPSLSNIVQEVLTAKTGVTVNLFTIPEYTYEERLRVILTSNEAYDLVEISPVMADAYRSRLTDLSVLEQEAPNLWKFAEDFVLPVDTSGRISCVPLGIRQREVAYQWFVKDGNTIPAWDTLDAGGFLIPGGNSALMEVLTPLFGGLWTLTLEEGMPVRGSVTESAKNACGLLAKMSSAGIINERQTVETLEGWRSAVRERSITVTAAPIEEWDVLWQSGYSMVSPPEWGNARAISGGDVLPSRWISMPTAGANRSFLYAWLDNVFSPEGRILLQYGIENYHYFRSKAGKIEKTPSMEAEGLWQATMQGMIPWHYPGVYTDESYWLSREERSQYNDVVADVLPRPFIQTEGTVEAVIRERVYNNALIRQEQLLVDGILNESAYQFDKWETYLSAMAEAGLEGWEALYTK